MTQNLELKKNIFDNFISKCAKSKIGSLPFDFFLKDIPNDFFLEKYSINRKNVSSSILFLSGFISLLVFFSIVFFDAIASLLIAVIVFLAVILYLIRVIRRGYLTQITIIEQYSELICREMLLIFSSTISLRLTIEYIADGGYPVISKMFHHMLIELNLGKQAENLLKSFAQKQPSETLREFICEIFIPILRGSLSPDSTIEYETQWRLRTKFDSYLSQMEGKLSLFLAITTIIPITISMLLVLLGFLNVLLVVILPLIFFVLDLVAIEIFNSGKITLLGGSSI